MGHKYSVRTDILERNFKGYTLLPSFLNTGKIAMFVPSF
jgi:hypothetical protein